MKNLSIKKIAALVVFISASFGLMKAQDATEVDRAVGKDNVLIEVFYGSPIVNIFENAPNSDNIDSELGVMGLRVEFVTSNVFGFGIEGSFMKGEVTERIDQMDTGSIAIPTEDLNRTETYSYTVTRFMPRFDFHLIKSEKMDFNVGVGVGTIQLKSDKITLADGSSFKPIGKPDFPMTVRMFIGGKYFFTDNIGFALSTGIGGGYIVKTALVLKF